MQHVDLEKARLQICKYLPQRARWVVDGTPLDFDFSLAQCALKPIQRADVHGDIEDEWLRLYLFGQEDFAEGGGALSLLGIDAANGEVHGLDVERDASPLFFLNSGVDEFIQTFLLFDGVLRSKRGSPNAIPAAAQAIDPQGFAKSDWQGLAELLLQE